MSNPHKIALVGFSSFERATFESFFRLAARRPPGYVLVATPAEASLAVVNADDPATMRAAMASKPCAHVMLIGNADGGTGWALQRRPLNLMKVLTNVEQLLTPHAAPIAPAATPPVARVTPSAAPARPVSAPARPVSAPSSGFAATRPFAPLANSPVAAPAPSSAPVGAPVFKPVQAASAPAPLASGVAAKAPRNDVRIGVGDFTNSRDSPLVGGEVRHSDFQDDSQMDHILVVDDSDIALKFMRNRLTRFGFRTDLVNSGEEALGRVSARPYKFVFLDVMMEGLDGYQTCRAIKQRKYSEGKPPVVVMLTSRGGTIDKIRGTLAGCDAYLTKPLNERDLIAVLAKHDRTVARGFQETNFGASAKSGFGAVSSR
jgi:two-component system, cell cycle response regulator